MDTDIDRFRPLWQALRDDIADFAPDAAAGPPAMAWEVPPTPLLPGAWIVAAPHELLVYAGEAALAGFAESEYVAATPPSSAATASSGRVAGPLVRQRVGDGTHGASVRNLVVLPRYRGENHAWFVCVCADRVQLWCLSSTRPEDSPQLQLCALWRPADAAVLVGDVFVTVTDDLRYIACINSDLQVVHVLFAPTSPPATPSEPVPLSCVCLSHHAPVLHAAWRPRNLVLPRACVNTEESGGVLPAWLRERARAARDPALLLSLSADGAMTLWRETDPWDAPNFLACSSMKAAEPFVLEGALASADLLLLSGAAHPCIDVRSWQSTRGAVEAVHRKLTNLSLPPRLAWVQRVALHDRLHWCWPSSSSIQLADTSAATSSVSVVFPVPPPSVRCEMNSSAQRQETSRGSMGAFPVPKRFAAQADYVDSVTSPVATDHKQSEGVSVCAPARFVWPHHGHWSIATTGESTLPRMLPDPLLTDSPANHATTSGDYVVLFTGRVGDRTLALQMKAWRIVGARDQPQRHLSVSAYSSSTVSAPSMDPVSMALHVRACVNPHAFAIDGASPAGSAVPDMLDGWSAAQLRTLAGVDAASIAPTSITADEHGDGVAGAPSMVDVSDDISDIGAAADGAALSLAVRMRALRTRAASALATSAVYDLMDRHAEADVGYDGYRRHGTSEENLLSRTAVRSGRRGTCAGIHSNRAPQCITIADDAFCVRRSLTWQPSKSSLSWSTPTGRSVWAATVQETPAAPVTRPLWHPDILEFLLDIGCGIVVDRVFRGIANAFTISRTLKHHCDAVLELHERVLQATEARNVHAKLLAAGLEAGDTLPEAPVGTVSAEDVSIASEVQRSACVDMEVPLLPWKQLLAPPLDGKRVGSEADAVPLPTVATTTRLQVPIRLIYAWLRAHPHHLAVASDVEIVPSLALEVCQAAADVPHSATRMNAAAYESLLEELPKRSLPDLSPHELLRCQAVLEVCNTALSWSGAASLPLDPLAFKFYRAHRLFMFQRLSLPPQLRSAAVSWDVCAFAACSESQDALLNACWPTHVMWQDVRAAHAAFWLRSPTHLRDLLERVAKTEYAASDKNPWACTLPYLALGLHKLPVLRTLFKLSADHQRIATFLSNNFREPRWQAAAVKNGYALLGQHRYDHAAAFFLLAGRLEAGLQVIMDELGDFDMALCIARLWSSNAASRVPDSLVGEAADAAGTLSVCSTNGSADALGGTLFKQVATELLLLQRLRRSMDSSMSAVAASSSAATASVLAAPARSKPRSLLGDDFDEDTAIPVPTSVVPSAAPADSSRAAYVWSVPTATCTRFLDDVVLSVLLRWLRSVDVPVSGAATQTASRQVDARVHSSSTSLRMLFHLLLGAGLDALSVMFTGIAEEARCELGALARVLVQCASLKRGPLWKVLAARILSYLDRHEHKLSVDVLDSDTRATAVAELVAAVGCGRLAARSCGDFAISAVVLQPELRELRARCAGLRDPGSAALLQEWNAMVDRATHAYTAANAAWTSHACVAALSWARERLRYDASLHASGGGSSNVEAIRRLVHGAIETALRGEESSASRPSDTPLHALFLNMLRGSISGANDTGPLLGMKVAGRRALRSVLQAWARAPEVAVRARSTSAPPLDVADVASCLDTAQLLLHAVFAAEVFGSVDAAAELAPCAWMLNIATCVLQRSWADVLSLLIRNLSTVREMWHVGAWTTDVRMLSSPWRADARVRARYATPKVFATFDEAWCAVTNRHITFYCIGNCVLELLHHGAAEDLRDETLLLRSALRALMQCVAGGVWHALVSTLDGLVALDAQSTHAVSEGLRGAVSSHMQMSGLWWQQSGRFVDNWLVDDPGAEAFGQLQAWTGASGMWWLLGTERRAVARALARRGMGWLPDVRASSKVQFRAKCDTALSTMTLLPPPSPSVAHSGQVDSMRAPVVLVSAVDGYGVTHVTLDTRAAKLACNRTAQTVLTAAERRPSGVGVAAAALSSVVTRLRTVGSSTSLSSLVGRDESAASSPRSAASTGETVSAAVGIVATRAVSDTAIAFTGTASMAQTSTVHAAPASAAASAPSAADPTAFLSALRHWGTAQVAQWTKPVSAVGPAPDKLGGDSTHRTAAPLHPGPKRFALPAISTVTAPKPVPTKPSPLRSEVRVGEAAAPGGEAPEAPLPLEPLHIPSRPDSDVFVPVEMGASATPTAQSTVPELRVLDAAVFDLPASLRSPARLLAHHPSAPLYVRTNAGGKLFICSVSLEPPHSTAEVHAPGTVVQCVHRLNTALAYRPLSQPSELHPDMDPAPGATGARALQSSSTGRTASPSAASQLRLPQCFDPGRMDEHITRIRWSPDGRHVMACFASGIVRRWDVGYPDEPDHTMSTSAAHSLAQEAATGSPARGSTSQRVVWAATDIAAMTLSSSVLAVTAAPVFQAAVGQSRQSPGAQPGAAPPRQTATATSATTLSELLHTGWGLHIFDLRTGDAAVSVAVPYPENAGCTSLLYDDASLGIVLGLEDGGMLLFDVRQRAVIARVPGVPLVAGHVRRTRSRSMDKGREVATGGEPVTQRAFFAHAGAVSHIVAHPSHRACVSAGHDGDVKLWDLPHLLHAPITVRAHTARPIVPLASEADLASTWMLPYGVAALEVMEDIIVTAGHDGGLYGYTQSW